VYKLSAFCSAWDSLRETSSPSLVKNFENPSPEEEGRSVIIRVCDALGRRGRGTIVTTWPANKVFQTNLLEDDGEEVPFKDGKFEVELGPSKFALTDLFWLKKSRS
jgi:hypothetical protein